MTLSSLAADFAAEINAHDWSDATSRFDRAGHRRENDTHRGPDTLKPEQVDYVKVNVAAVVAQVLGYTEGEDFDPHEFFFYAGVARKFRLTNSGRQSGAVTAGLRISPDRRYDTPGSTLTVVERDASSREEAMAGFLRVGEEDELDLSPRDTVLLRFEGMIYGSGTVSRIEVRHTWKVVVWDQYDSYTVPRAG
ncbi:hypothetical protein CH254_20960 [Rhodococcus sp. 06-412-2C]|uniref:hypothetical protein n=1 Tax=unclassified Rhodococcus (in: high G+C Gram-positive bacteria) TaxID=192944 RepID=UPI000B9C2962|nr:MULTISPECIES: hypothetical protein [unclassified Rhodococcus (in: high G+C Gram-positive bacteria)]OZC84852.1 hypothetical protein CH254_20960 [Rhodococcus sp. 06-412-2C]OZC98504.1 hypothetical protein CH279_13605 [Rhodococcus sp. 06-412-2B]